MTLLLGIFTLCMSLTLNAQDNKGHTINNDAKTSTTLDNAGVVGGLGGTGNTVEDNNSNTRGLTDLKDITTEQDTTDSSLKTQKKDNVRNHQCQH